MQSLQQQPLQQPLQPGSVVTAQAVTAPTGSNVQPLQQQPSGIQSGQTSGLGGAGLMRSPIENIRMFEELVWNSNVPVEQVWQQVDQMGLLLPESRFIGLGIENDAGVDYITFRNLVAQFRQAFPNLRSVQTEVFPLEGAPSLFFVRWRRTGRLAAPLWGLQLPPGAMGRDIIVNGVTVFTLRGQQIVESRGYWNTAGFLRDMGVQLPLYGAAGASAVGGYQQQQQMLPQQQQVGQGPLAQQKPVGYGQPQQPGAYTGQPLQQPLMSGQQGYGAGGVGQQAYGAGGVGQQPGMAGVQPGYYPPGAVTAPGGARGTGGIMGRIKSVFRPGATGAPGTY